MPYYYFALASQDFLINKEPVEEILRERTNYYHSIEKDIDFWLLKNSDFVHYSQFRYTEQKFNRPMAAIVSLDAQFIQWLKLRVGFVKIGTFESSSLILE
nr:hypothetical protein [Gloiopeltis furcata]